MSKKVFFIILGISVGVTWLSKEIQGILNFTLGGLTAGLPISFYKCSFISSCNIVYELLFIDIAFWFAVTWIVWKILQKVTSKK